MQTEEGPSGLSPAAFWLLLAGWLASALAYSFHLANFLHAKDICAALSIAAASVVLARGGPLLWRGFRLWTPAWLLLALMAGIHLAGRQAAVPSAAAETLARSTLLLLAGALAYPAMERRRWRTRFAAAYAASATVCASIALFQWSGQLEFLFPGEPNTQRMYGLFGNNHLLAGWLAGALPLLARWTRLHGARGAAAFSALLVVLLAIVLSGTRTAWLLTPLGLFWGLASGRGGKRWGSSVRVLTALALVGLLGGIASPGFLRERMSSGLTATGTGIGVRLWLWDGAARIFMAHPWVGAGPGNFAFLSPRFLGEALHAPGGGSHVHNLADAHYAHCEPLHLAAETGIAGLLLGGWMVLRLFRGRGLGRAVVAIMLLYGLASFPWASAPHALAAIFFGAMAAAQRPRSTRMERRMLMRWRGRALVAALAVGLAAFYLWAVVWPGALGRQGTRAFLAGRPDAALRWYAQAADHPWPQYAAYRDFGLVLLDQGRYAAGAALLTKALEGLDNGPVHAALGAAHQLLGDTEQARAELEAAVFRTPGDAAAWERLLQMAPVEERSALAAKAVPWLDAEEAARLRKKAAARASVEAGPD